MKPPMNYPASVSNTAMLLDKSSGKPKASLMGVLEEMQMKCNMNRIVELILPFKGPWK